MQYLKFLERAIHGDFGVSTQVLPGTDALDIFWMRLPATLELAFFAMLLAIALGIPLGYFAARRRGSALDNSSIVVSLVGVAVPVFFTAFMLKYFFAVAVAAAARRPGGRIPHSTPPGSPASSCSTASSPASGTPPGTPCSTWCCPSVALATIPFAVIFRITRASVLDVLDEDYVRTAEAKGLTARTIRGRHVLRNAMLPVTTIIGLQVGGLLAGAVLTETVFAFGGIGQALYDALPREGLPRAPGADPGGGGDLRAGQPARRHLLRDHRPPRPDEVTP